MSLLVPLERDTHAARLNSVLNDPVVRPWVADAAEGVLDLSDAVANPNNVLLMGEFGGCMFFQLIPGIYEVHTQVLPHGRGVWARALTYSAAHWMFTRTNAYELLTRVPHGHVAAKAATLAVGARHEFTRYGECRFRGKMVPVDIYAMRIQDWVLTAPRLPEIGESFHDFLAAEAKRLGVTEAVHDNDPNHNRFVGAALEMARHEQVRKAVIFYNRWALMARHSLVGFIADDPPTIRMDLGLLRLLPDGRMEVSRDH